MSGTVGIAVVLGILVVLPLGTAAPPDLRAATRALAERRIARVDAALSRPRRWLVLGVAPVAALAVAVLLLWWRDSLLGIFYALYFTGIAVLSSSPVLRRHRTRAAAALAANPPP